MDKQVEERKKRVSSGPFRHYLFDTSEVLSEAKRFLRQVGYELKPPSYIGFVQPDFQAKRQAESGSYEIAGIVRENLDQAVEALIKLASIKAVKDDVDCVLVLPPINEYLLIEFLKEEKGRWYFAMKDAKLIVWFCNPDDQTTMCAIGAPTDDLFQEHFLFSKISFDQYMSMMAAELYRGRLEEEEF